MITDREAALEREVVELQRLVVKLSLAGITRQAADIDAREVRVIAEIAAREADEGDRFRAAVARGPCDADPVGDSAFRILNAGCSVAYSGCQADPLAQRPDLYGAEAGRPESEAQSGELALQGAPDGVICPAHGPGRSLSEIGRIERDRLHGDAA